MKKNIFLSGIITLSISLNINAQEGLYQLLDPSGKLVCMLEYDEVAYSFGQGLSAVRLGDHWGYINDKGIVAIPSGKAFYFEEAGPFGYAGLARVKVNNLYGYVNNEGRMVVAPKYDDASDFDAGFAAVVMLNDKYGLINRSGKLIIPTQYDGIQVQEKFASVYNGSQYALYNIEGLALSPFEYDYIGNQQGFHSEGMIPVLKNEQWGFINTKGQLVIQAIYDEVGLFTEGLAGFSRNGAAGFVNTSGIEVIPAKYSSITPFSSGLAAVLVGEKWGFIDKTGKLVIPAVYEDASPFNGQYTSVKKEGIWLYIDKTNKVIPDEAYPGQLSEQALTASIEPASTGEFYTLNYPQYKLKVEKKWRGFGNADAGKIYDLNSNQLLGEQVVFENNFVVGGTFYHDGKTLKVNPDAKIALADLRKTIEDIASKSVPAASTSTANPNVAKFEQLQKRLVALTESTDASFNQYRFIRFEFDVDASTDAERAANLERKLKPFIDQCTEVISICDELIPMADANSKISLAKIKSGHEGYIKEVRGK